MGQKPESERKPYLDGVRGVAACVVFFAHLSLSLAGKTWVFNGNAAVCIFFVLSGYVLSELVQRSPLSFPAQVVRRYLRLVVPMLLTSAFAWVLLATGLYRNQQAAALLSSSFDSSWLASWYKFDPSFRGMIGETLYSVFIDGRSDYNCNLWTMQPELIGSLYVFAINAAARSRPLRTICYLALGAFYSTEYIMLFAVGALLHDFHGEIALKIKRSWIPASTFLLALVLCESPTKWLKFVPIDGMYWQMAGATLLVLSVLHLAALQALLGNALGRLLGRISFVLYLIHVPIICGLTAWIVLFLPASIAAPIAGLTTVIVVFATSIAIYRWVDQLPTQWSRTAGYAVDTMLLRRHATKPHNGPAPASRASYSSPSSTPSSKPSMATQRHSVILGGAERHPMQS